MTAGILPRIEEVFEIHPVLKRKMDVRSIFWKFLIKEPDPMHFQILLIQTSIRLSLILEIIDAQAGIPALLEKFLVIPG